MSLNPWVCRIMYVSRVIFSVFALVFNSMVGFVVLSVCRTHTIGIRRFIRELEEDGKICDQLKRMSLYGDHGSVNTEELGDSSFTIVMYSCRPAFYILIVIFFLFFFTEQQYLWDDDVFSPPSSHLQPPEGASHPTSPVRQRKLPPTLPQTEATPGGHPQNEPSCSIEGATSPVVTNDVPVIVIK